MIFTDRVFEALYELRSWWFLQTASSAQLIYRQIREQSTLGRPSKGSVYEACVKAIRLSLASAILRSVRDASAVSRSFSAGFTAISESCVLHTDSFEIAYWVSNSSPRLIKTSAYSLAALKLMRSTLSFDFIKREAIQ